MKSYQAPFDVELFDGRRDWGIFGIIVALILCVSLTLEFRAWRELKSTKEIEAQVLLQYKKEGKNHFVLKLKTTRGETLYTTSRDDLRDLRGRFVSVYGKLMDDCGFVNYLRSCFFLGYSISLLHERDYKDGVKNYISKQHDSRVLDEFGEFVLEDSSESLSDSSADSSLDSSDSSDSRESLNDSSADSAESAESTPKHLIISSKNTTDFFGKNLLGQMYNALFLATPMPKELRDVSNIFGVAHIFAISGFHLGVLSFVLYGLLSFPYRALQGRFFTYRNEFYDLNFIVLIFALIYLYILDFSPSFLRSFVMFAFGFFVLFKGLRLVSFKLLFACVLFILALFPRVLFSVGFWLSVSGIFYIYLCLKHIKIRSKWLYATILNIIVTLNMIPLSHFFFFVFSPWVAISPFITMAFVVFYPAVLVMHILGFGDCFDSMLFFIAKQDFFYVELKTSMAFLCAYIVLSLVSIRKRRAYYALIALSVAFFVYGIARFLKGF